MFIPGSLSRPLELPLLKPARAADARAALTSAAESSVHRPGPVTSPQPCGSRLPRGQGRGVWRTSARREGRHAMAETQAACESVTIAGRPDRVAVARAFAAAVLGRQHPQRDTAVLLLSEL